MRLPSGLHRFVWLGEAIFLGAVCLTPAVCFGGLTWESQKIEVAAELEATSAAVVFHFKNTGSEPNFPLEAKSLCLRGLT